MNYQEQQKIVSDEIKQLAEELSKLPEVLNDELYCSIRLCIKVVEMEKHLYKLIDRLYHISRDIAVDTDYDAKNLVLKDKEIEELRLKYQEAFGEIKYDEEGE